MRVERSGIFLSSIAARLPFIFFSSAFAMLPAAMIAVAEMKLRRDNPSSLFAVASSCFLYRNP
jgi:hypothetical protein